ncbi:FAD binding domain-containing protein [Streptomyces sp. NPDC024089]|uniref:FAD binding domain-containing protein n=1 Tax=Streptomyces sp. NPDC024089 TaxID=3154328 RepID=UPI0033E15F2E
MIPAAFDYVRPDTLDEAVRTLHDGGEDAKVLAGGQSLIPILRLRLAFPELLVDLGRIPELRGVREDPATGSLVVGAMTTHHDVIHDPLVRRHAGLLAAATETVADPAVRHRGTLGGSLSHAVPAREFFVDYLRTALADDEVLVEIRVPKADGWGFHYEKFSRVAQGWAIVGVAALVRRADGRIDEARIGLTNMGSTPLRASATEAALAGAEAVPAAVASAADAAAEGTRPATDLSATPEYRAHLARVLTRRAVLAAAGTE